jgi:hypothetical protein
MNFWPRSGRRRVRACRLALVGCFDLPASAGFLAFVAAIDVIRVAQALSKEQGRLTEVKA